MLNTTRRVARKRAQALGNTIKTRRKTIIIIIISFAVFPATHHWLYEGLSRYRASNSNHNRATTQTHKGISVEDIRRTKQTAERLCSDKRSRPIIHMVALNGCCDGRSQVNVATKKNLVNGQLIRCSIVVKMTLPIQRSTHNAVANNANAMQQLIHSNGQSAHCVRVS